MRSMLLLVLAACSNGKDGGETSSSNPTDGGDGHTTLPGFYHDVDQDGFLAEEDDCDDNDADVHPGADEHCNGVDDDCDQQIDEDAVDPVEWYPDVDQDGFGDESGAVTACTAPTGFIGQGGDCDDTSATAAPGAAPVPCDGFDNDCDPSTFEAGAVTLDSVAQPDLPTALAAALDGSTIELCEGQYSLPETRLGVSVTVRGLGAAEVTQIRGAGGGTLFRIDGGSPTFEGLTLTGGSGRSVGGGDTQGGALWVGAGLTVSVQDALITGNKAGYGGGVYLDEGATLSLVGSAVDGNSGDTTGALISDGGGIYAARGATVALDDSHVDGNDAELCGGLDLLESNEIAGSNGSTISGNASTSLQAGGICVAQGAVISGVEIRGNTSSNTAGGIFAYGGLVLTDATVADNYSPLDGGGITASTGDLTLTRVVLDGNLGDIDGGAISASGGTAVTLVDSTVTGNNSTFFAAYGAVLLADASLVSTHTDWGVGATDNAPADVGLVFSEASFSYDGLADFACSDSGGNCQ